MRKILTIKHWQLVAIIVMPAVLFYATPFGEIIGAGCGLLFLLWIYSIGYFGQQRIRSIGLQPMNLKMFQMNVLLLPVIMYFSKLTIFKNAQSSDTINLLEMVIGLYSAFAAFQILYFSGKSLAILEYRRQVSFAEYVTNSFQILIFIFGVWTLQSRINRQFEEAV